MSRYGIPPSDVERLALSRIENRVSRTERRAYTPISSSGVLDIIPTYDDPTQVIVQEFTFEAIQAAIDAADDYTKIYLPAGTYTATETTPATESAIQVDHPVTLVGVRGATILHQTTDNTGIISLTCGDATFEGITFQGPQYAVYTGHTYESAIKMAGTSQSARVDNVHIRNCTFHTFGYTPVWLQYVDGFTFHDNELYFYCRAGLLTISCSFGDVRGNHIHDLNFPSGTTNQYGFQLSRDQTASLEDSPRSSQIVVDGNVVEDVSWEGIDTHAGQDITVSNNIVRNCEVGIAIVGCPNEEAVDTYGPQNVTVVGNVVDGVVTDGSKKAGIQFVGPTPGGVGDNYEPATGSITGNTVIRHGAEGNTFSGGIQVYGTQGLSITGNTVVDCGNAGIIMYHTNDGINISGNTIVDPWSDSSTNAMGIWARSSYNNGYIGGNSMKRGDLTGKNYYLTYGVYIQNAATHYFTLGTNHAPDAATSALSVGASAFGQQTFSAQTHHKQGVGAISTGTGPVAGEVMLDGTTAVVVNTTAIKASGSSIVLITPQAYGTTPTTMPVGTISVYTQVAGSYFSVKSSSASDTGIKVGWLIVNLL